MNGNLRILIFSLRLFNLLLITRAGTFRAYKNALKTTYKNHIKTYRVMLGALIMSSEMHKIAIPTIRIVTDVQKSVTAF